MIFPSELNVLIVASDGRPRPSAYSSDTLAVLPRERCGVLLESSTLMMDSVQVDYFSLNTEAVWNTQYVNVTVEGYLNTFELEEEVLSIYPNPFNGGVIVNIPSSDGKLKEMYLASMVGRVLVMDEFTQKNTRSI